MAAKRILITSAKGGVGKSTVAVHLASAFAAAGRKTLLLDLASVNRALDLFLGLSDEAIYDLGDLFRVRVDASRALMPVPGAERLFFVPGLFRPSRLPTLPELLRTLSALEESSGADVLILDSGWDELTLRAASAAGRVLIVTDTDRVSIRAAENTAAALPDCKPSLVINRVAMEEPIPISPILETTHLPLIGLFPETAELRRLAESGQILALPKNAHFTVAARNTACRLCGGHMPLLSGMRRIKRKRLLRRML